MKRRPGTIILILTTSLISVVLLFITERWITDVFIENFFTTLAISGLTVSVFSIISNLIDKNNLKSITQEYFPLLNKIVNNAIIDYGTDYFLDRADFKTDFLHSKSVTIVMSDGKLFYTKNNQLLLERLSEPKLTTNYIIHDYKQADTISVLTRKNGHSDTPDYYVNKIHDLISRLLINIQKDNLHTFNIYLNPNFNSMRIILTDNYAMYAPYRQTSAYLDTPSYLVKSGGKEYENIRTDITDLMKIVRKYEAKNDEMLISVK